MEADDIVHARGSQLGWEGKTVGWEGPRELGDSFMVGRPNRCSVDLPMAFPAEHCLLNAKLSPKRLKSIREFGRGIGENTHVMGSTFTGQH